MLKALILISIFTIPIAAFAWDEARPDPVSSVRHYTYTFEGQKVVVAVDDASATFSIEIPESQEFGFYSHTTDEMINGVSREKTTELGQDVLYGSYYAAANSPLALGTILPSLECCAQRGKFFDDAMYASCELALENGGDFTQLAKNKWCYRLAELTLGHLLAASAEDKGIWEKAATFAVASAILSSADDKPSLTVEIPDNILIAAQNYVEVFRKSPLVSKPVGFYSLSPELQRIFTRDRYLQHIFGATQESEDAPIGLALAMIVLVDEQLASSASFYQHFYGSLTNPPACLSPEALSSLNINPEVAIKDVALLTAAKKILNANNGLALLPPSRSVENDLINELGGLDNTGGDTMQILIQSIKNGTVSLAPKLNSGWYSYQQYALETLLKLDGPEAAKLIMNDRYRQRLQNAFCSLLAQARETHIKQLQYMYGASTHRIIELPPLTVKPDWLLEPIPTYYQRVADGYAFLGNHLSNSFAKYYTDMMVFDPLLDDPQPLDRELTNCEKLFAGFNCIASRSVGVKPVNSYLRKGYGQSFKLSDAALYAEEWLRHWGQNPMMERDIRVIVPLGVNTSGQLNCWCVLGIHPVRVNVKYLKTPSYKIVSGHGSKLKVNFQDCQFTLLVPVFTEVVLNSSVPMTRDEFRALCDKGKTQEGIIQELANYRSKK